MQLKVWKLALWWAPFVQSIYRFRWKGREELCLMTPTSDPNFEEKWTFCLKNDMRNLLNFNASSGKSENFHFDVLLLLIAYKFLAKRVQKNYLSWHYKVNQTLKKNWLFVCKMTWGIWWILTRAVESLKICTLMG